MAHTLTKRIKVTPESDLNPLLDEAQDATVLLEREGTMYRLYRVGVKEDISYVPDPDFVRQNLEASIGTWSDLDTDQIIQDIYDAREAGSRPPDRP